MNLSDEFALAQIEDNAPIDPVRAFSVLDDTTRANTVGTVVGHTKGAR